MFGTAGAAKEYYAKTLCAHTMRLRGTTMQRWSSKDLAGMLADAPDLQQKLAGLGELWRWVITDADMARRAFSPCPDEQDKPRLLPGSSILPRSCFGSLV